MTWENRPWGKFAVLWSDHKVKLIIVKPRNKTSLQYHRHRTEHWHFLQGDIESSTTVVAPFQKHRLENKSKRYPLVVLELQEGHVVDENDIVRLEDSYGRVSNKKHKRTGNPIRSR